MSRSGSRPRANARRASSRRSSPARRGLCRRSSAPRSPGPGSSTSCCATGGSRRRWPRSSMPGRASARARPGSASASRSRWSRPTRRGRSRSRRPGTARSATRVARLLALAGHEVEREYYYNDAGAQMERFRASVEAVRRGEEPPEDGYKGDYVARAGAGARRPGAGDAASGSRRRWSGSGSTSTRGRCRASSRSGCRSCCPGWTRTSEDGARLGALVRVRRRRGPGAASAPRRGDADLPGRRRRLPRRQARARLRPGDLRARRRPPRHAQLVRGGRAHARLRPRARRGAALPARPPDPGRRAGEDVEAARATSSSSTTSSTRSASTPPAGTWSTAAPTRRSRSTSTSPPSGREKNPVYYVQYAHARIAGILRNAGGAAGSAEPPAPLAPEERDLVKRLAGVPRDRRGGGRAARPAGDPDVRDPRRRRLPPLLPPPPGARERRAGFRLGLCRATRTVIASLPRPGRGRGA